MLNSFQHLTKIADLYFKNFKIFSALAIRFRTKFGMTKFLKSKKTSERLGCIEIFNFNFCITKILGKNQNGKEWKNKRTFN